MNILLISTIVFVSNSYHLIDESLTWQDGNTRCNALGSTLATIISQQQQNEAIDLCATSTVLTQPEGDVQGCFFGLNDISSEGTYKFVDNTPLSYSFWASGQPNDVHSSDNCVRMSLHPAQVYGSWFDDPCSYQRPILCNTIPTPNPTLAPTINCEDTGGIKHINWNELQNAVDNSAQIPESNFSISLNENTLELTFDINLEYIGHSSDGNLGTTYVVGFDSFGTWGNLINEPGNCENRILNSFLSGTFDEWWDYSEYPYSNNLGSNTYLAYPPPSEYWTLSIDAFTCSPINYYGIFSWNDLSQCADFNGDNLIDIIDDGTSITLSGTLYVNVVSPYSMDTVDSGYYRTFPVIQQDFEISILKQVNILSSTGIDLFITSIIGIYEDETDQSFELSVFIQTADYMQLINPSILNTPLGATASISSVTSSCLTASTYSCGQIFTITINETEVSCPPADFSGIYSMSFDVECRFNEIVCNTFINDNDGTLVLLQVESNFVDNYCEPEIYKIVFDGNMTLFDDDTFLIEHNELSENYVIGQDVIYVEIEVEFPDDGSGDNYNIFNVVIDNVFVCTADDQFDLTQNLTQQNGIGGCLSSNVDPDGEYIIIENGMENDYNAQIIQYNSETNVVRFSFLTFDVGRITMYIHAQLTLELINENERRRILSASTSNQIRHFISSTSITNDEETIVFVTENIDDSTENDNIDGTSRIKILVVFISSISVYITLLS